MKTKWFWMWVGGAIGRVAGTGLIIGIFTVLYPSKTRINSFSTFKAFVCNVNLLAFGGVICH